MLVHRTGTVTCNKSKYSYWGCDPNHPNLMVVLTDKQNRILAPAASTQSTARVDGTIWQVTPPLRLPSCSVLPRNLTVSLLTASCACAMNRIYVTSPRATTVVKHAQTCMVFWLKPATDAKLIRYTNLEQYNHDDVLMETTVL